MPITFQTKESNCFFHTCTCFEYIDMTITQLYHCVIYNRIFFKDFFFLLGSNGPKTPYIYQLLSPKALEEVHIQYIYIHQY